MQLNTNAYIFIIVSFYVVLLLASHFRQVKQRLLFKLFSLCIYNQTSIDLWQCISFVLDCSTKKYIYIFEKSLFFAFMYVSAEESLPAAVVCANLCPQWSEFTSVCIHREVWDSRFGVERRPPRCFYMPPTHLLV